ncbi:MAG: response regulator transcription factor [Chloroflexi bacterium]|nr:response regulator transcription factor [Chloroflexota bacterium]
MARIIIADDEQDFLWALRRDLSMTGHEVIAASDGVEALALARRRPPDLLVLDIAMPHLDGLQAVRRLRSDSVLAAIPVLFLTARSAIDDRVRALEAGGDDYLVKPFDLRELGARIHALLRRVREERAPHRTGIAVGPLVLDPTSRDALVNERVVHLSPIEFDLLHLFMSHPGELFSGADLLQLVWGYRPDTSDVGIVRWHIKKLRDKLEGGGHDGPSSIRTVRGHGYGVVGTASETQGRPIAQAIRLF